MRFLIILFVGYLLVSCTKFEDLKSANSTSGGDIEAYRAKTVLTEAQLGYYSVQEPRNPINVGKVAVDGKYLFINEIGKGIHVYDNSKPENPQNKIFISIPGNRDFYVKDLVFFADNGTNLINIDAKSIEDVVLKETTLADYFKNGKTIKLLSQKKSAIKYPQFPMVQNVFFECPDTTKGLIVEWEKVKLSKQPNCYR